MLTPAQLTTLRPLVLADATALPLVQAGNVAGLQAYLNGSSGQDAWKPVVSMADIFANTTISSFDNLSQGKRDAFQQLIIEMSKLSLLDATKASCRKGFADIFAVTGSYVDAAQLGKMLSGACVEKATRAEVMLGFTTPAATGTTTAIKRSVVGALTEDDVKQIIFRDNGSNWSA